MVMSLVQNALEISREYLEGYDGDYRFLLKFRNSQFGICIEKQRKTISLLTIKIGSVDKREYDIVFTTRLSYLKWSLTEPYGDEILFVGSGGLFEYSTQLKAKQNLHRELLPLLKKRNGPPPPRYGTSSKLVYNAKQAIKQIIGRRDQDLYDLARWTVFHRDKIQ
jgi:hypothetical protein